MIKKLIAPALLLWCNGITAQQKIISNIIKNSLVTADVYTIAHPVTEQSFTLPCDFGKSGIHFPEVAVDLESVQVTAIDLVFTDYPAADPLIKLNTARLQNLFAKYPQLATDTAIEWKLVRQTGGAARAAAIHLFHGFVFYYRPLQNAATMRSDIMKLKDLLTPTPVAAVKRNGFVIGDTTLLRTQYEIEEYTTVLKLPVADALAFLDIDKKEKITYKNFDSLFVYLKPGGDSTVKMEMKAPPDSTIIKVFERMGWNKMLVVADVTASMYPYSGQLLLWLKLHEDERRINGFVFFNDGDDKDDDKKVVGNTGGIYATSSSVFEMVEQLVFKTMSNGNGGNIPENNLEALLKGLQTCNDCRQVVMIADNAATVNDMALLEQVHQPVHIILCGVHDAININYLDIARFTGGSVHTAEEDIQQLVGIKEGEKVLIHGHSYRIKNGRFVKD